MRDGVRLGIDISKGSSGLCQKFRDCHSREGNASPSLAATTASTGSPVRQPYRSREVTRFLPGGSGPATGDGGHVAGNHPFYPGWRRVGSHH